ncbi:MAG: hypothetical protein GF353_01550 [Candidatus Lokiarchaeota archaeon]|nr:hypothetical protein [Candidatus Lokiarchaeota archaeon]
MEIQTSNLLDLIKSRRSVRHFEIQKLTRELIREILECGRWAPSKMNNQPWKVNVVTHPTVRMMLAELSSDGEIIEQAYTIFVVFLDLERASEDILDYLSIGAFVENILLAIQSIPDLGGLWIGDIVKNKEKVNEMFKMSQEKYECVGLIAFGKIDNELEDLNKVPRERREIDDFIEWY